MQKEILFELLSQNKMTCAFAFDRVTEENARHRLNGKVASIGFIYRHIGETINLFGFFFGLPTEIPNTTMGQQDIGLNFDLATSRQYVDQGYEMLSKVIQDTEESAWLGTIETPFFGTISRMRLFSHILFHNAHHAGQIALTLAKGNL